MLHHESWKFILIWGQKVKITRHKDSAIVGFCIFCDCGLLLVLTVFDIFVFIVF